MIKTIRKIVEENTPLKDLSKKDRSGNNAIYRAFYIKLARELTRESYEAIGKEINRDRCTAYYWEKNLDATIQFDKELKQMFETVKSKINNTIKYN